MATSFDTIRNYYEKIVIEHVRNTLGKKIKDQEYLADVACVALNQLPPRYIRYEVDMIFYLSPVERKEIEEKISVAIEEAVKLIAEKNKSKNPKS